MCAATGTWDSIVFTLTRVSLSSIDAQLRFRGDAHAALRKLLAEPTVKAADRLWADVASPYAWKEKYLHDLARYAGQRGSHGPQPSGIAAQRVEVEERHVTWLTDGDPPAVHRRRAPSSGRVPSATPR